MRTNIESRAMLISNDQPSYGRVVDNNLQTRSCISGLSNLSAGAARASAEVGKLSVARAHMHRNLSTTSKYLSNYSRVLAVGAAPVLMFAPAVGGGFEVAAFSMEVMSWGFDVADKTNAVYTMLMIYGEVRSMDQLAKQVKEMCSFEYLESSYEGRLSGGRDKKGSEHDSWLLSDDEISELGTSSADLAKMEIDLIEASTGGSKKSKDDNANESFRDRNGKNKQQSQQSSQGGDGADGNESSGSGTDNEASEVTSSESANASARLVSLLSGTSTRL